MPFGSVLPFFYHSTRLCQKQMPALSQGLVPKGLLEVGGAVGLGHLPRRFKALHELLRRSKHVRSKAEKRVTTTALGRSPVPVRGVLCCLNKAHVH